MKGHKKKMFMHARGFYGRQKNCWTIAIRAVHRAWQKAYIGRRLRQRDYRSDWIQKINAASRQFGLPYAKFVRYLPAAGVDLNRKVLADLAVTEPYTFRALVQVAERQRQIEEVLHGSSSGKEGRGLVVNGGNSSSSSSDAAVAKEMR